MNRMKFEPVALVVWVNWAAALCADSAASTADCQNMLIDKVQDGPERIETRPEQR